ncbi:hypothetical protein [Haloarcula laminariae]|uniref:hypothetical protein n=1 Tax=Haloarcula laminariae TaxID=2961577 RepID=UPI0024070320|nr:hypothetical protein [Halomicroarcula sp. FL173]
MADNYRNVTGGKAQHTSRRRFMRTVSVTGTMVAVGTASTGGALGAENTVDLGAEGLSDGDLIGPYLEEFFADGTTVYVPAGEYDFSGDGLGGEYADAALVGAPDGVTLNRPTDPESGASLPLVATTGTVRIENIAIRGGATDSPSRPNRIEIDGTGGEAGADYEFAVGGDLALDEGHTVVGSDEPLWLSGDIGEGHVSGHVRDGVDSFFYSGDLERIEIDGDADITVAQG